MIASVCILPPHNYTYSHDHTTRLSSPLIQFSKKTKNNFGSYFVHATLPSNYFQTFQHNYSLFLDNVVCNSNSVPYLFDFFCNTPSQMYFTDQLCCNILFLFLQFFSFHSYVISYQHIWCLYNHVYMLK